MLTPHLQKHLGVSEQGRILIVSSLACVFLYNSKWKSSSKPFIFGFPHMLVFSLGTLAEKRHRQIGEALMNGYIDQCCFLGTSSQGARSKCGYSVRLSNLGCPLNVRGCQVFLRAVSQPACFCIATTSHCVSLEGPPNTYDVLRVRIKADSEF